MMPFKKAYHITTNSTYPPDGLITAFPQ